MKVRHVCANCGRERPTADLFRSYFTDAYFCATQFAECEKRGARRIKKAKREAVLA
jgi:hypothetical protein